MARIIAFFLPQFHDVPENNEWWGEGFTEWTNVKRAKSYFKGHMQPRVPLNNNYYDLLEKDTMVWQTSLIEDAGIEGLCYYHYWFKGKKILEKPAENLLHWKDINQKFCFSWANESWKRTWDKNEGNDWNELIDRENKNSFKNRGMLLEQDYGDEKDWIEHFNYLLQFFKDERYIKHNGHPIFIIYKPSKIECLDAMLCCWEEQAIKAGINTLYIIATNEKADLSTYINASLCYEPSYTFNNDMPLKYYIRDKLVSVLKKNSIPFLRKYNYELFLKKILQRGKSDNVYRGIFVGFDDTPRRGLNGVVFKKVSPEGFRNAFSHLLRNEEKSDFVFITAWNEWAEGAYLEPDNVYKKEWINVISQVIRENDIKSS